VAAGVLYVEFTDTMSPEELPKYLELANHLETRYGLTVRFNIAYFRTDTPTNQNATVLKMLKEIDSPVVTGIDLLANEGHTPALENGQAVYGPVLAAVKLKGAKWRRTMHAGELGDVRNPRDALLLGAERLGHGVRLIEDPVTLQYAVNRQIPIEINLSSNIKLQAISDIRQHPFLTYLRLGLPVSLSTDDEGIFQTDINNECVVAVGQTDVTYYEYKEMAFNSIRTAFVADDVKQRLLKELTDRFDRFEKR
jgi:adenosine deaminase